MRRDFAAAHPGLAKDVHHAFLRSRELCLSELDEAAAAAARWEPFDAATLATYFRVLDFSLGERQVAGLREFARRVESDRDTEFAECLAQVSKITRFRLDALVAP